MEVYIMWQLSSRTQATVILPTPYIWTGLVGTFIYMMDKLQFVWLMHMRITIAFTKFGFRVEHFKMDQRTTIKSSVKVKKLAREMFKMLKSAMGKEWLFTTGVFVQHKTYKEDL